MVGDVSRPYGHISNTILAPKFQETSRKERLKDCESERTWNHTVRSLKDAPLLKNGENV